jgi:hypothetical protein
LKADFSADIPGSPDPDQMAINTESGLDQLDEWIKECKTDHPRCQRARELRKNEKPFIPTRLIELIGPGPEGGRLRLIETSEWSDEQSSRPYLTLSHCWGDPKVFKVFCTYPNDVTEFLVNIELAKLPKTFENVMRLAWKLGISYVWIDSICIIQGSKGDFNIEAQLVTSGYESVVVLILSLYIHPTFPERPSEWPFGANRYHKCTRIKVKSTTDLDHS